MGESLFEDYGYEDENGYELYTQYKSRDLSEQVVPDEYYEYAVNTCQKEPFYYYGCIDCETTDCSNCVKDRVCKKCKNCHGCRTRRCDTNLTSNTPAVKMQIQKIIQNVVRVPSSLYTMNLGVLTAYRNPHINWNRMSDRGQASVQKRSETKNSTQCRPGALSPGGVGCDIKHNSYARHLNRLKGRGPLRHAGCNCPSM